jgi:hypothetical protein
MIDAAVAAGPDTIAPTDIVLDVLYLDAQTRDPGLRVVPQRTGHNAGPLGDIAGTVLLRTDAMREVSLSTHSGAPRVSQRARSGRTSSPKRRSWAWPHCTDPPRM